jgi:hypothetical protein
MEIQPAPIATVQRDDGGRMVEIPGDVGNVVADLRRLDPTLRVRFSEHGRYYVVYQLVEHPDGRTEQNLVLTAMQLDQRIVKRVEKIMHPSYNFVAELRRGADDRKAESRRVFRDKLESRAAELAHAARKDLGVKDRIAL